jgi:hypothetical protein
MGSYFRFQKLENIGPQLQQAFSLNLEMESYLSFDIF